MGKIIRQDQQEKIRNALKSLEHDQKSLLKYILSENPNAFPAGLNFLAFEE